MDSSRIRDICKASFGANWLLLLLVGLHTGATLLLARTYGFQVHLSLRWQLAFFAVTYALMAGVVLLARLARRPAYPLQDLLRDARGWNLDERLVTALPALLALSLLGASFGALKSAIPAMHPYTWDATFAAWDVAIHGDDVWRIIQPLVGVPPVSSAINLAYHLWILLFNMALAVACAMAPGSALRKQFLVAVALCWALIGNLAATLMASVGPCFVLPMLGDPRYVELMAYLRRVAEHYPMPALMVQDMLLHDAQHGLGGLGFGISAMPSMHVSIAMLIALGVRRIWPRWQWAAWLFLVTIMIGSVHLGYHYAVDGYVALAMTLAVWMVTGWLTRPAVARRQPKIASGAKALDRQ
jgi:hypothetical protein